MRIKHKGLWRFVEHGSAQGIDAAMTGKLKRILRSLAAASSPSQLDNPGWRVHPLRGELEGYWSVRVNRNWRVTFRFENGEAVDVDLIDYH
ncbi:MAG: type II toxin-antitoxin system RelE/ParE family toxin [Gammaproteobacteria bacterium]|nr:type II toxin-antitoxin system RelE/ParE family toxin [Gammaproteobacteria bacterium]MCY4342673.1 type II toxin-antitoxin system RelE/ParE family toxin [Gammaproteobacteria bacterium]